MFTRAESLQTNLCERFAEASSSRSVNISSLEAKPFSVTGAERVQTKYGVSTPHDQSAFHRRCACIPSQKFHTYFTDVDKDMINHRMIKINLIYHGICEKTNA
jgi:hypothetical protein